MKLGMSGHFRIEKREVGTNRLVGVREFDNLVTNRGLDGYGVGVSRLLGYCALGKGTNAPAPTDVALGQYSVTSSMVNSYAQTAPTAPDYVASGTWRYRFNAGVAVGIFSEIGIGTNIANPSASNSYLFSRALIVDEHGQPSSITILENEYLDVYYTLNFHQPINAIETFTFDLFGVTHTVTGKIAYATGAGIVSFEGNLAFTGGNIRSVQHSATALGDITGTVNGIESDRSSSGYPYHPNGSPNAYVVGTYTRSSTFGFGLGNDNYEQGISGIQFNTRRDANGSNDLAMQCQYLITPPIPKTVEREMTLTFQWSWGRYGE